MILDEIRVVDSGNLATDGLFGESKTDLIAIGTHNLLNLKESWDSVDGCYGKTHVIISVTTVTTFTVLTCD